MILNALEGRELPLYGTGENVRDWLYVEDHARALVEVLARGEVAGTYNIGGRSERKNIEVVEKLCDCLDELVPDQAGPHRRLIRFVEDRPGHDRRYAIDDSRIATELAWQPRESFESGLEKTVRWYIENQAWVEHIKTGAYRDWLETNYAPRRIVT